jgi:hypothetical protein
VPSEQHSAAPSALGYQYQTSWCLLELLRRAPDRPDEAISLELHDDVAWDDHGSATELLQLKHHHNPGGNLGDKSVDLWKTLQVWLHNGNPADPQGPILSLVTTSEAAAESAAASLRAGSGRDTELARALLENAATTSTSQETATSRAHFLDLSPAERQAFLSRVYVADSAAPIEDVDAEVRRLLWWALPQGQSDTFMSLVWRWWASVSLDMLRRRRTSVDAGEAHSAIDSIRDQFSNDTLPTLIELDDIDEDDLALIHESRTFVQQMRWVSFGARNLRRAIVDYHRAVTQTTDWLDRDLIGLAELRRFELNLRDEWERVFEDMVEDLPANVDDKTKARAGLELLRTLRESTAVTVRTRYNDPFFARGKRHELADIGAIGWHPDFQARLEQLLAPSA